MSWSIVKQERMVKGERKLSPCVLVTRFPRVDTTTGDVTFVKMRYPFVRIVIGYNVGECVCAFGDGQFMYECADGRDVRDGSFHVIKLPMHSRMVNYLFHPDAQKGVTHTWESFVAWMQKHRTDVAGECERMLKEYLSAGKQEFSLAGI